MYSRLHWNTLQHILCCTTTCTVYRRTLHWYTLQHILCCTATCTVYGRTLHWYTLQHIFCCTATCAVYYRTINWYALQHVFCCTTRCTMFYIGIHSSIFSACTAWCTAPKAAVSNITFFNLLDSSPCLPLISSSPSSSLNYTNMNKRPLGIVVNLAFPL